MDCENVRFTIEFQFDMGVPQEKYFDYIGGYVKIKDEEALAKVGLDYLMSNEMATDSTPPTSFNQSNRYTTSLLFW